MLDLAKMLGGLFQNGAAVDPTQKQPIPIQPAATLPTQGVGINPNAPVPYGDPNKFAGVSMEAPSSAPITQAPQKGADASGKTEVDWKERMMGGLQGLQAAQGSKPQEPAPMPMDLSQIKQLQFAHTQNRGIIPPKGRY